MFRNGLPFFHKVKATKMEFWNITVNGWVIGSANKVFQSFIQTGSRNLSLNIEQRKTSLIVD